MTPSEQAKWQQYIFDRCEEPDENGCLNWTGALRGDGYGHCGFNGKNGYRAHRLAYEAFKRDIPAGLVVRHTCNNPRCVNADHLVAGTQAENMADKSDKTRSKLSAAQVGEIKRLLKTNEISQNRIADKFGVNSDTIHQIACGRCWKHIN